MPPKGTACHTCKLRRVKCDGLKPTCQRCTKANRVCTDSGIAQKSSFAIHLENTYASGQSKRPRGPRSSLIISPFQLQSQPQLDLKTKALTYYLQHHFDKQTPIIKIRGGLSESVTVWLSSHNTDTMVDLALSTMALGVFSRIHDHPPAASESSVHYQNLLRVMNRRITDFCTQTSTGTDVDACLLTVCILGRYEGVFPRPVGQRNALGKARTWPHHDGSMAVLKYWFDHFSHIRGPTAFTKRMRREMIKHCLLRGMKMPDWSLDGSAFGEEGLELEYDRILVRVVNLHQITKTIQQELSYEIQIREALALGYELELLDESLQEWEWKFEQLDTCPYSWREYELSLDDDDAGGFPRLHFHSRRVYGYPSQGLAGAWCDYFGTAMLLLAVRLRVLDITRLCRLTGYIQAQQQEKCYEKLDRLAGNIAATIPFCLGRAKITSQVDGEVIVTVQDADIVPYQTTYVIWALTIASCLDRVEIKQRNWFKQELAAMGKVSGEAVLEYAIMDEWVSI